MKAIKLSPDLEKALLQGVITGHCAPEIVNREELSKKGQGIYDGIDQLIRKGGRAPFKPRAVALAAAHLCGMEKADIETYLVGLEAHDAGSDINTILRAARDKATLVSLVNRAGEQLASGDLRVSDLTGLLANHHAAAPIRSLSASLGKRWPKTPHGIEIPSLPEISDVTRGMFGIWVIAGEPGLGKSTLAWQIALELNSPEFPVLYYDLDGTGQTYFVDRTREIVSGSMKRFKRITRNLYFRSSINTLEEDLQRYKPPALLVIDSPQTLPIGVRFAKESLDNWIRRFKELSQKGYSILMISEKARSEYGEANLGGFKGTGDIEYGATMCAHILAYDDDPNGPIKFVIVKNRHGSKKGHIVDLERDSKRTFWWREIEPFTEEDNEPKQKRKAR